MPKLPPLLCLCLSLWACASPPGEPEHRPAASSSPSPSVWSRGAAPARSTASSEPKVASSVDPTALDELLAEVPAPSARVSTAPDGGTSIGHGTGLPDDPVAPARIESDPEGARGRVSLGPVVQPDLSDAATERAARAQLYWSLVQRCRDKEGRLLPPEVVHLSFRVDVDGYVVPPTIVATSKEDRFALAARCMSRELSNSRFRVPAAARGRAHTINADVPSVD